MAPPISTHVPVQPRDRHAQASSGCPLSSFGLIADRPQCDSIYRDALTDLRDHPDEALAVYVHVPFCHVRCLYCACDTTITHSEEKVDAYLDSLEREFSLVTDLCGRGRRIEQLYIGGGTPNHLNEPQLARLMEIVDRHFTLAPDASTAIECNPRHASAGQLELIHGLGFRQISFGVQDLNADVQRAIGRMQSLGMVRDVYLNARDTGFETITLDLIYGLPFQTPDGFQNTLDHVVELAPDRISCFSYAHDPVKRPHQHAINSAHLPSPGEKLALFQRAVKTFSAAGYQWIGLDLFACPQDELSQAQADGRLYRNAIGYAPLPRKQVLAFGPSGMGEVQGVLVRNESNLRVWEARLEAGELPLSEGRRLSEDEQRRREALVHLMCNLHLPANASATFKEEYAHLRRHADQGLLVVTDEGIRLTPEGRYLLHGLCLEIDGTLDWKTTDWSTLSLP